MSIFATKGKYTTVVPMLGLYSKWAFRHHTLITYRGNLKIKTQLLFTKLEIAT